MKKIIAALLFFIFAHMAQASDTVVVNTNFGSFTIALYRADAPKTVENFTQLSAKGYYDSIRVHRISRGFVIQAGDPQTRDLSLASRWGTGGASIYGNKFEDELNPATQSYKDGYQKGVVAMANAGPNTNGSQFFVLLDDATSWMPHSYTIFGKVISGMDVVENIGQQPILGGLSDGRPQNDVIITSIKIQ